jgi:hypothetical protein
MMNVVYLEASLLIPRIYCDAWRAGLPGPNESRTAQGVIFTLAVASTLAFWRVSGIPAIRVWKEHSGLPARKRVVKAVGVVCCPFQTDERSCEKTEGIVQY